MHVKNLALCVWEWRRYTIHTKKFNAVLKKVLATLLGLFGGPSDLAPGALPPTCPPFVTLLCCL